MYISVEYLKFSESSPSNNEINRKTWFNSPYTPPVNQTSWYNK